MALDVAVDEAAAAPAAPAVVVGEVEDAFFLALADLNGDAGRSPFVLASAATEKHEMAQRVSESAPEITNDTRTNEKYYIYAQYI